MSFEPLSPWQLVGESGTALERELYAELGDSHPLARCSARAVARRSDSDDVLFEVNSPRGRYAVVHLTWTGKRERDPQWPDAKFYSTLDQWVGDCMVPDHREFEHEGAEDV